MPTNKNALARYKILDELLSDGYHSYSVQDLNDACCRKLDDAVENAGDKNRIVSLRQTQKDLKSLGDPPFNAEIEHYTSYFKRCVRYSVPGFSIFKKMMTDDERYLLQQILDMIGRFDGLPEFQQLDAFKKSLDVDGHRKIISISRNPLGESRVFGEIYSAILHEQVIELHYHKFGEQPGNRHIPFNPYLLKEYNQRWFLFGTHYETDFLLNFALDRIDQVVPTPEKVFKEYAGDVSECFDSIVGVTFHAEKPCQKIEFWVSDKSRDYVETKPIHESQKRPSPSEQADFRHRYPSLVGGTFYSIDCIENYELIRELSSFGPELIVLSPADIRKQVTDRLAEMQRRYVSLR